MSDCLPFHLGAALETKILSLRVALAFLREGTRKLQKLFSFVKLPEQNEGVSIFNPLHSEWPKLCGVLAILSAIGLKFYNF